MTSRRPLYRTVLGLAVAALLAAWLPFSVMYLGAATNHALVIWKAGHAVITTRTSGGQSTHLISTAAGKPAAQATAVTTRSS